MVCTSRLLHPLPDLFSCLSPKVEQGKHSAAPPPAFLPAPLCPANSFSHCLSQGKGLCCVDKKGLGATVASHPS